MDHDLRVNKPLPPGKIGRMKSKNILTLSHEIIKQEKDFNDEEITIEQNKYKIEEDLETTECVEQSKIEVDDELKENEVSSQSNEVEKQHKVQNSSSKSSLSTFQQIKACPPSLLKRNSSYLLLESVEYHPISWLQDSIEVPAIPDDVNIVRGDVARALQKAIAKIIKTLLLSNKDRIEEFKINTRLFGTDFMEAKDYLVYLTTEFGDNKTLLMVPCLLQLQAEHRKRKSLLDEAQKLCKMMIAKNDTTKKIQTNLESSESQNIFVKTSASREENYLMQHSLSQSFQEDKSETKILAPVASGCLFGIEHVSSLHTDEHNSTNVAYTKGKLEELDHDKDMNLRSNTIDFGGSSLFRHDRISSISQNSISSLLSPKVAQERQAMREACRTEEQEHVLDSVSGIGGELIGANYMNGMFGLAMLRSQEQLEDDSGKYYTEYVVGCSWTDPDGVKEIWEVGRRYREFSALDLLLREKYSRLPISTFPGKKYLGSSLSAEFVDRRQRELGVYLCSLIKNFPTLVDDELLDEFLDIKRNVMQRTRIRLRGQAIEQRRIKAKSILSELSSTFSQESEIIDIPELIRIELLGKKLKQAAESMESLELVEDSIQKEIAITCLIKRQKMEKIDENCIKSDFKERKLCAIEAIDIALAVYREKLCELL